MAAGFTPATKIATLGDSSASTKDAFLASLKSIVGSAKNVNFNYAGHGIRLANGEFALVLPSVPPNLVANCTRKDGQSDRGLTRVDPTPPANPLAPAPSVAPTASGSNEDPLPNCKNLDKYLVTASDLKGVFGNRKVFGILDACHAGSFDLGKNSSMLLASEAKESAQATEDGANGAFTARVKRALDNSCMSDLDGDQQVSMHELAAILSPNGGFSGHQVASRGLGPPKTFRGRSRPTSTR